MLLQRQRTDRRYLSFLMCLRNLLEMSLLELLPMIRTVQTLEESKLLTHRCYLLQNKQALDTAVQRTKSLNLPYGQVVVFAKNSNGEWRSHVVSTAKLNEAEQTRTLELLAKSSDPAAYNELVDLVGLNTLEPGEFDVIRNLFLQVEDRYIPGNKKACNTNGYSNTWITN